MNYERFVPPRANLEVTDAGNSGTNTPALWIPSTSANLCLLFPMALGAWLQRRNWQAMGKPDEALTSLRWAIASVVFWFISSVPLGKYAPPGGLMGLIALLLLIFWYYGSAKPQILYVANTYGKDFPRRSWLVPMAVGVVADLAWYAIASLAR